jgi:hypothetical protein
MWVVIIFHKFGSQLILNVRPVENVKSQCLLKIQTPAMSREHDRKKTGIPTHRHFESQIWDQLEPAK